MDTHELKRYIKQAIKTVDAINTLIVLSKHDAFDMREKILIARLDAANAIVNSVLNEVIEQHAQD